ncbi:MAG: AIR synthase family protein [Candidatus Bathyarchaeia archaeon]
MGAPLSRRFPTGKVPVEWLKRAVFNRLGIPSSRVLRGPGVGEDAAILEMGDRVLAVAADPITGAVEDIGRLMVHINANDIASCGVRPRWLLCIIMLPEGSGSGLLEGIMEDIHSACCEVGVSLIGGHTETVPGLDRPILSGFMMGEAEKGGYVTSSGASPGDVLIMTKSAGIEGTAVLAKDLSWVLKGLVGEDILRRAEGMLNLISVVPEAMRAMEAGGVHSLHDPTEGGILNGVWEMAEASGIGVEIWEASIPVASETRAICEALSIDPLKLLGSGALLISAEPSRAGGIISAVGDAGVKATVIGRAKEKDEGRILVRESGERTRIEAVEQDHLYIVLDRYGMRASSKP